MKNTSEYTYDESVIETLKGFCNLGSFGPGALLYNPNTNGMHEQLSFIAKAVQSKNINYVLETGTESGLFCYYIKCLLPEVKVITFGMNGVDDNRAQKCTDFLNSKFNNYIKFIEGDSKITLTSFTSEPQINFAWIDGGHDVPTLTADLNNCKRLNIPTICIDDYYMIHDIVQPVIEEFIANNPEYRISAISDRVDDRGICLLEIL
jgi:hypothetical protein